MENKMLSQDELATKVLIRHNEGRLDRGKKVTTQPEPITMTQPYLISSFDISHIVIERLTQGKSL